MFRSNPMGPTPIGASKPIPPTKAVPSLTFKREGTNTPPFLQASQKLPPQGIRTFLNKNPYTIPSEISRQFLKIPSIDEITTNEQLFNSINSEIIYLVAATGYHDMAPMPSIGRVCKLIEDLQEFIKSSEGNSFEQNICKFQELLENAEPIKTEPT